MNIQQVIIKGIQEQLYHHNYLVLPGFGGFVLKSRPSHFSAGGGALAPPSKTLGFNAQLKQNDGILALWLQQKLECTPVQALDHLQAFTGFCKSVLNVKRRLDLPGIGFFYIDFENNVCFEPNADANFQRESFGLAPVAVKAPEEVPTAHRQPVFTDRVHPERRPQAIPPGKKMRGSVTVPVLAALALISILSLLVLLLPVSGELRASLAGNASKAAYVPIQYPELKLAATPELPEEYVADANGVATLELGGENHVAVRVFEAAPGPAKAREGHRGSGWHSRGDYEVVLGCFSRRGNAHRLIGQLSSHNIRASITGRNSKGMYVVSETGFRSREEALTRLGELKSRIPSAWLKKVAP